MYWLIQTSCALENNTNYWEMYWFHFLTLLMIFHLYYLKISRSNVSHLKVFLLPNTYQISPNKLLSRRLNDYYYYFYRILKLSGKRIPSAKAVSRKCRQIFVTSKSIHVEDIEMFTFYLFSFPSYLNDFEIYFRRIISTILLLLCLTFQSVAKMKTSKFLCFRERAERL